LRHRLLIRAAAARALHDPHQNQEHAISSDDHAKRPIEPNGVEPPFSEDDLQREQPGPRGIPGQPDPAKMTPQREKKTPANSDFDGHTA
jgi:hypothetical protein